MTIPVIDIFAGPGGLGEGFSSLHQRGQRRYEILLSVDNDPHAHKTLELRAFFHHFERGRAPADYYHYLQGPDHGRPIDRNMLFDRHPAAAEAAGARAWLQELGPKSREAVGERIKRALRGRSNQPWILIGGPPCQAYSTAGRSRMKPVVGKRAFDRDNRHLLYEEYLSILANHRPAVFVMENVKGLLSSRVRDLLIVDQILTDLENATGRQSYRLCPLSPNRSLENPHDRDARDLVISSEYHGIPQTRHRVIILGIREDLLRRHPGYTPPALGRPGDLVPAKHVLSGLPPLRSGLSSDSDSSDAWREIVRAIGKAPWVRHVNGSKRHLLARRIRNTSSNICAPRANRGAQFVPWLKTDVSYRTRWFMDSRLGGAVNHESRAHMEGDLHRYLFAACFASVYRFSPKLRHFPEDLLPDHENVRSALRYGMFNDRFRVQVKDRPATTITSHLRADGHYFIHPDARQCRSLTVREAARIQTFPDNYFFEGPRTAQYRQVGNAVPALLARQIAAAVSKIITDLTE